MIADKPDIYAIAVVVTVHDILSAPVGLLLFEESIAVTVPVRFHVSDAAQLVFRGPFHL